MKDTILPGGPAGNPHNCIYPEQYGYCIRYAPAMTVCPPAPLAEPPLFPPNHLYRCLPPKEYP